MFHLYMRHWKVKGQYPFTTYTRRLFNVGLTLVVFDLFYLWIKSLILGMKLAFKHQYLQSVYSN